jgi:hypothetical protein
MMYFSIDSGYYQLCGNYLRVVTLDDGETVHTAYPDRNFARRRKS